MPLVEYSDSDSDSDEDNNHDHHDRPQPPTKKRRKLAVSDQLPRINDLPPLPATFLDLYSSTVRTTTQDDPALHDGRKRVTPHVEGKWPTHVYLEWYPQPAETKLLSEVIAAQSEVINPTDPAGGGRIHSSLYNELGVALPLHISLSRPLVLRTEEKQAFLEQLEQAVRNSGVKDFQVTPSGIQWHPNEVRSRWFLTLSLQVPFQDAFTKLLEACNTVASDFSQPLLYRERPTSDELAPSIAPSNKFHVSIAWTLQDPSHRDATAIGPSHHHELQNTSETQNSDIPHRVTQLQIAVTAVKLRMGQDVHVIPLPSSDGARATNPPHPIRR